MIKQKLWALIEAYRTVGGKDEHLIRRDMLDAALDKTLTEQPAPAQRKPWVGLTHQERNAIRGKYWIAMSDAVFDDIEAKLKEKNS